MKKERLKDGDLELRLLIQFCLIFAQIRYTFGTSTGGRIPSVQIYFGMNIFNRIVSYHSGLLCAYGLEGQ